MYLGLIEPVELPPWVGFEPAAWGLTVHYFVEVVTVNCQFDSVQLNMSSHGQT